MLAPFVITDHSVFLEVTPQMGCEICFTKSRFATGINVSANGNFILAKIR